MSRIKIENLQKYLKDNICTIYDHRPTICNVDLMYEKYYKEYMSKEKFYELNSQVCTKLKEDNMNLMKAVI